jgi:hypothetical protein
MTLTEPNLARGPGELKRDGRSRLSRTVDSQRRLTARQGVRRADTTRTKADPFGPNDPRYAYLTRGHG